MPKGDIVIDCGHFLLKKGYDLRIFNTINFRKSMHYNPFQYIHSEKDILKLTTTLIANTKGDGKAGDEFWTKAETLLYCALIGYIHYEAPKDEQNFATLIEFLNIVLGTSYTAEDADILGADQDYTALETALRRQIDNIESTHSGYDEYRYNLAEIGHNPYELAALLTVEYEDYTRAEVQSRLQSIFNAQYTLTLEEEVEIRTRTETRTSTYTDPDTGVEYEEEYEVEVEYEYYILNVTLTNKGIAAVARASGLSTDQSERFDVLLETRGNRDDLFGDVSFAVGGGEYTDYDIPGEALTDEKFRKMITEAEKYLGYPYVWGGSSPSTSFDCSGFVCWVINHCGNGWNVGRTTANGLMSYCDIIPRSEAKPGDLIFFQGTYDTAGASHVAIYVGNNMFIHCGNPISYASLDSAYWTQHYYCTGRIR